MKKILMAEPLEYDNPLKVGNHQYAKLFSENGYEVLWLDPIYSYITHLINKEGYYNREKAHKDGVLKVDENMYEYAPKSTFMYGNKFIFKNEFFSKLTLNFTRPNIKNILESSNFLDVDILWLSSTKYYHLKNVVNYDKLIHRVSDDISGFNTVCKSMLHFEEKIIKEADKVFVTANDLLRKKKYIRNDLIYLPNGVELNNFIRDIYTKPSEFCHSDRSKCIFVGAVHEWVDIELIKYCAEKLQNIDFYIIGPVNTNISQLKGIYNIKLLGKKNYQDIPNYLYYSDVAIIPFKVNDLTNSITPVKLYEYMSVGLSVVSTNFREINYINSPAYIAKDKEEFVKYILKGIRNKEKNKLENIRFAEDNTWNKRFEFMMENI